MALVVAVVVRDTPATAGLPEIDGVGPTPDRSVAEIRASERRVLREPVAWGLGAVLDGFRTGETVADARVYTLVGSRSRSARGGRRVGPVVGTAWLHCRDEQ